MDSTERGRERINTQAKKMLYTKLDTQVMWGAISALHAWLHVHNNTGLYVAYLPGNVYRTYKMSC